MKHTSYEADKEKNKIYWGILLNFYFVYDIIFFKLFYFTTNEMNTVKYNDNFTYHCFSCEITINVVNLTKIVFLFKSLIQN